MQRSGDTIGRPLKTYACNRLAAVADAHESARALCHCRDPDGRATDFAARNDNGDLLGIEVAATTSADAKDARRLHRSGENLAKGRSFTRLALHPGKAVRRWAARVWSAPISCLWE